MRSLLFSLLLLVAGPAAAEEVVLGLSKDKVAITATFEGSDILVFGAVKREVPIPSGDPLEVLVTVSGPNVPVTIRRKDRVAGIWVNTDSLEIDGAPSFYAVATSGPLEEVLSPGEDLRYQISIPRVIRSAGALHGLKDTATFADALIRIRSNNNAYQLREGRVAVDEQTLFRTSVRLPSNLTEGAYKTRIFLTRGGKVVSRYETEIAVRKVGMERWLYTLSRENPLWYGLMSLAIAIFAGWAASAAFQVLQRR